MARMQKPFHWTNPSIARANPSLSGSDYSSLRNELEQLEKNYGLHPLAIEDALKANQLPKVDVYGDQLFVMTRDA
jgi:hypothetical protein